MIGSGDDVEMGSIFGSTGLLDKGVDCFFAGRDNNSETPSGLDSFIGVFEVNFSRRDGDIDAFSSSATRCVAVSGGPGCVLSAGGDGGTG